MHNETDKSPGQDSVKQQHHERILSAMSNVENAIYDLVGLLERVQETPSEAPSIGKQLEAPLSEVLTSAPDRLNSQAVLIRKTVNALSETLFG